jgi:hypothetical protein
MSPEITTRSVRGDKRFSASIKRASAAAVSTRPQASVPGDVMCGSEI